MDDFMFGNVFLDTNWEKIFAKHINLMKDFYLKYTKGF
jgi:hypothetical protein